MDGSSVRQGSRRLALLQIARTGGTTLHRLLADVCAPGELRDSYPTARSDVLGHFAPADIAAFWTGLSDGERKQCRILAGHIPFGFDEWLDERFEYACFLRDPVERLLSGFLYGTPALDRMTPDQLMFGLHRSISIADSPGYDNSLTRVLAATVNPAGTDSLGGAPSSGVLSRADLDRAIHRLSTRFVFVGLAERFDDSCRLLFQRLEKSYRSSNLRLNATSPKLTVDSLPLATLRLIERRHALDLAVYEAGRKIFNEHAERAGLPVQPPLERRTSDVGALTSGDHAHTVSGDSAFGLEPDGVWLSARPSAVATESIGYLYPTPFCCGSVTVQLASHLGTGALPFRVEASHDEFTSAAVTVARIAVPADGASYRFLLTEPGPEVKAWRIVHESSEDSTPLAVAYLSFSAASARPARDMTQVRERLAAATRAYRPEDYGRPDEDTVAGCLPSEYLLLPARPRSDAAPRVLTG